MKKIFGILIFLFGLMNCAFAALTPLPASLNCNLSGKNLVCQNVSSGMMIAGWFDPVTAGVYNYANYAELSSDGLLRANYKTNDNNHFGTLILGNNHFQHYFVDTKKTVTENPNWKYNDFMDEYICVADADKCSVELKR